MTRLTILLLIACFSSQSLDAENIAPILYLPLDEGKGLTVTSPVDEFLVGALVRSPKWSPGRFNSGLEFSKAHEGIRFKASKQFDFKSFTFSCWLKPNDNQGYQTLFVFPYTWIGKSGLAVALKNGKLQIYRKLKPKPAKYPNSSKSEKALQLNKFTQLTITYEHQNYLLKAYFDGEQVIDEQLPGAIFFGLTSMKSMRLAGPLGAVPFKGVVDELTLFDRVLSSYEIQIISGKALDFKLSGERNGEKAGEYSVTSKGKSVFYRLKNNLKENVKLKLRCRTFDWRSELLKDETRNISVPALGCVDEKINLETDKCGAFKLQIEASWNSIALDFRNYSYTVTAKRKTKATLTLGPVIKNIDKWVNTRLKKSHRIAKKKLDQLEPVIHNAMINALADKKYLKQIYFPHNDLYGFLFRSQATGLLESIFSKPRHSAVLISSNGPSDIIINPDAPQVTLTDFLGNSSTVSAKPTLKLRLSEFPTYISDCGPKISIAEAPFQVEAPSYCMIGGKLTVKIHNKGPCENFHISLTDERQTRISPLKKLRIKQNGSEKLTIAIPKSIKPSLGHFKCAVLNDAKEVFSQSANVLFRNTLIDLKYAPAMTFDMNPSKWKKEEPIVLEETKSKARKNDWKGLTNLSAWTKIKWNKKGLFLLINILDDDIRRTSNSETGIQNGDRVLVSLDFRNKGRLGTPDINNEVAHLTIYPPSGGKKTKISFNGANSTLGQSKAKTRIHTERYLAGYSIGLFIAFPEHILENLKNRKIGINLEVLDIDSRGNNNKTVNKKIEEENLEPSHFQIYQLKEQ